MRIEMNGEELVLVIERQTSRMHYIRFMLWMSSGRGVDKGCLCGPPRQRARFILLNVRPQSWLVNDNIKDPMNKANQSSLHIHRWSSLSIARVEFPANSKLKRE